MHSIMTSAILPMPSRLAPQISGPHDRRAPRGAPARTQNARASWARAALGRITLQRALEPGLRRLQGMGRDTTIVPRDVPPPRYHWAPRPWRSAAAAAGRRRAGVPVAWPVTPAPMPLLAAWCSDEDVVTGRMRRCT